MNKIVIKGDSGVPVFDLYIGQPNNSMAFIRRYDAHASDDVELTSMQRIPEGVRWVNKSNGYDIGGIEEFYIVNGVLVVMINGEKDYKFQIGTEVAY